ncbi:MULTISPECIES: class 1 fructose-bisphosphatase [Rhizobium]|uniref:Fructose-1,6-bisphosphatase class 1 n=2 Tax=Rhizobium TaxID=379 RepID=A0A7W8XVC5_9HYPH|nr:MULTISPECIES: class 1 fructose-bisphosphatase [Rhizobium]ENN83665.1 inositol phosphatase/fructose-16-bisphosphatase [Rhizobium freirei PRF 81]MBB5576256.1 fructose-1,6-bisphosphatase I [Rhizobium paranaense]MDK4741717.1 class 1 fructose-bisphosphatase [Rhizobium sp. CNPSo 3464]
MSAPATPGNDEAGVQYGSVDEYLSTWAAEDLSRQGVAALIHGVLDGACLLSARIAAGSLEGDLAHLVGSNTDGDAQKAIDIASHELFVEILARAGAARVLSEEADAPVMLNGQHFAVAIDPIDGSGNVGLGTPVGTIFSIMPFCEAEDPFLTPGKRQAAAGYVSFGNTVDLGFSVGEGVLLATMHPQTGEFLIVKRQVQIPRDTSELAYNASNHRHLHPAMSLYLQDCLTGKEGTRGRDFNMRWLGSAVGELHRILIRGGVFFYAGDKRPGFENGRLRLVYEANPIAFLMEQAGGRATDGTTAILDKIPTSHHCRTPLVFGSATEVDVIASYLNSNPTSE